jgi:hypothetical protein
MTVRSRRVFRMVVFCLSALLVTFAVALASFVGGATNTSTVFAAPVDCAPVGVETIGGQLYYVENCFGYDVYRPL